MKKILILLFVLITIPAFSQSQEFSPAEFAMWYVDYGMYSESSSDWHLILYRLSMDIDRAKPWDIAEDNRDSVYVNMYAGVDFHKSESRENFDILPQDLSEMIRVERTDALNRGFFPCPVCAR